MRFPLSLAFLLAAALPIAGLAAKPSRADDSGVITTSTTVTASCSVGDLTISLQDDGVGRLGGSGELAVSQTGNTTWDIGTTNLTSGSNFSALVSVEGSNGLSLQSTQDGAVTNPLLVFGNFDGSASAGVLLTHDDGQFPAGDFGTSTTVTCVVQ